MQTSYYRPQEICQRLGVPAPTLREWSRELRAFLSSSAGGGITSEGKYTHRRYSDADVAVFRIAQRELRSGSTYEALRIHLAGIDVEETARLMLPSVPDPTIDGAVAALRLAFEMAIAAKDTALSAKDETIIELRGRLVERETALAGLSQERDAALAQRRRRWFGRG